VKIIYPDVKKSYALDGIELSLEICNGVYEPAEDTFLLARSINAYGKTLEIGSGSGLISIYLAKKGYNVQCTDINQEAVECIFRNQKNNSVSFPCIRSDLFSEVQGIYDVIIFNPPYLPTDDNMSNSEQWNGGDDGFQVTGKFLMDAEKHLSENGSIFIILSSLTNIEKLIKKFDNYSFEKIGEEHFFFETIFSYKLQKNKRD
jgi:release factor glutamine methyltransferase